MTASAQSLTSARALPVRHLTEERVSLNSSCSSKVLRGMKCAVSILETLNRLVGGRELNLIEVQFLSLDIAGWLSLVQKKDVCWAVDCSGLFENWTSIVSHTGRTVGPFVVRPSTMDPHTDPKVTAHTFGHSSTSAL